MMPDRASDCKSSVGLLWGSPLDNTCTPVARYAELLIRDAGRFRGILQAPVRLKPQLLS